MGMLTRTPLGWMWDEWRHRGLQAGDDAEDFLLVTWDSCRYDVYTAAHTPVLDRYGPAQRAWAMATYTLPAHQAMFNGFRRRGYATVGAAAMDWFAKPSPLQDGFEWFRVTGTGRHGLTGLRKAVCRRAFLRA
jgi:hypothetical protein